MEFDNQYKKVISILHKDFGWSKLNTLPDSYKDLINDIIKATKQVNKIPSKIYIDKPKIDRSKCPHEFIMKKEIFRCKICNMTMGQWLLKSKKDDTSTLTI